jgi:hypothetical protein
VWHELQSGQAIDSARRFELAAPEATVDTTLRISLEEKTRRIPVYGARGFR